MFWNWIWFLKIFCFLYAVKMQKSLGLQLCYSIMFNQRLYVQYRFQNTKMKFKFISYISDPSSPILKQPHLCDAWWDLVTFGNIWWRLETVFRAPVGWSCFICFIWQKFKNCHLQRAKQKVLHHIWLVPPCMYKNTCHLIWCYFSCICEVQF